MKDITFISDTHLGRVSRSHATAASSRALSDKLFHSALQAVTEHRRHQTSTVIHLGDLLDQPCNAERVVLQAYQLMHHIRSVLSGNHDETGDSTKVSSFQALSVISDHKEKFLRDPLSTTSIPSHTYDVNDKIVSVHLIPHKLNQEVFDLALAAQVSDIPSRQASETRILCLHSNYNFPFEKTSTTLNVTEDTGKRLLDTFDYILFGHEHMPYTAEGGRIVGIGSTHPTSFSDISDKFTLHFDGTTFTRTKIWDSAGFAKVTPDEFMQWAGVDGHVEFISIEGKVSPIQTASLTERLYELREAYPHILLSRIKADIENHAVSTLDQGQLLFDLPNIIRSGITDADQLKMFNSYLQKFM